MKRLLVYHYRYLPLSETFIYNQLIGLSSRFALEVVTAEVEHLDNYPGITPAVVPAEGRLGRLLCYRERFFARKLAAADLFHVNFGHVALDLQRHALAAGVPMTAGFLGFDASASLRNPEYVEALRHSRFRAVIACSEEMKSRLIPYLPASTPCFVVYCGTRVTDFPFRSRCNIMEGTRFLQISRLSHKKGVSASVEAFSRYVREVDGKATLTIAGDGPLLAELEMLARQRGVEAKVRFLGTVRYQELMNLMDGADVFLHPSVIAPDGDMEGIPTTIGEAMAAGLPVVSTRHGGIPELIEHGVEGLLAAEGDADDLFEQMVRLRDMDVAALSAAARRKVEMRFNAARNAQMLADCLHSLL